MVSYFYIGLLILAFFFVIGLHSVLARVGLFSPGEEKMPIWVRRLWLTRSWTVLARAIVLVVAGVFLLHQMLTPSLLLNAKSNSSNAKDTKNGQH